MRTRRLAALIFGVIGLAGVAQPISAGTDLDDIRLAVFRQQVAFWLDGHARESKVVVCLSVEEGGARALQGRGTP